MFRITAGTCCRFTLAEILILAAMNVETIRAASAGGVHSKTAAGQNESFSPTLRQEPNYPKTA
jgi:hypothetical protein